MVRIIFEDIKHNGKKQKDNLNRNNFFSDINFHKNKLKKNEINKSFDSNKLLNISPVYKQRLQSTPQVKGKIRIIRRPILVILLVVLVFYVMYWIGNSQYEAKIVLTEKEQIVNLDNQNFIASKNGNINNIEFEIMIISDKKFKKIVLTEPKEVSIKAKGSIILYNEFSTNSQKLLAGTFVSDNDGKTYQIDNTITIPGYSQDGNKILPGQVIAEIQSFLPGENYNGSPVDFNVISFKGTNKYNKIYGKLKNPLVGGATGLYYSLNDIDKVNLENIAKSSLRDDLLNQVKVLFPQEYILYPDATTFSYKNNDDFISKTPESEIEIEGVLSVVLFKKESLVNNITKFSLPDVSKDELKEINIFDLEKLSINFNDKNQIISKETTSIPLKVNGKVNLVWTPNTEILKLKLLGVPNNEVLSILRQDKGISSASVKIFPPWNKYIPSELSKINITFKE